MSDVVKRCPHTAVEQNKCKHPWYMKKFIYQGEPYADNVTRWATINLPTVDVTTRTKADEVVEIMRTQIRAGAFVSAKRAQAAKPKADPAMTLAQLVADFDRDVLSKTLESKCSDEVTDDHRSRLRRLVAFGGLGARAVHSLDGADLVAFRTSPEMRDLSASSWAKYFTLIKRVFRHAKRAGIIAANPLDKDVASDEQWQTLRRQKQEPRTRRLKSGEEARLLAAARVGRFKFDAQRLLDLIVAALECAARLGELLALRWADVDLATAPAVGTLSFRAKERGARKTKKPRVVPISKRLREVLHRRRVNPLTGQPYPETAYVFGNEVGARVKQMRSWAPCVVRAEGHTPTFRKRNLSVDSRAVYETANLHFHDLRRECASRWLESHTFSLKTISKLLGHANISQTSTYLEVADGSAIDAMRAFDAQRDAAEVLPVAVGASDYKATTNENGDDAPSAGPRLVKGNKRRGENNL